jgi:hypothetical protein
MKTDPTTGRKNSDFRQLILFSQKADVTEASEPSNIIWENLAVEESTRTRRKIVVFTVSTIFLFVCFMTFTAMKDMSGQNKLRYPASTDC